MRILGISCVLRPTVSSTNLLKLYVEWQYVDQLAALYSLKSSYMLSNSLFNYRPTCNIAALNAERNPIASPWGVHCWIYNVWLYGECLVTCRSYDWWWHCIKMNFMTMQSVCLMCYRIQTQKISMFGLNIYIVDISISMEDKW